MSVFKTKSLMANIAMSDYYYYYYYYLFLEIIKLPSQQSKQK